MPIYRCEFDVEGDLVLPRNVDDLQHSMSADFTLTIRNEAPNCDGHTPSLIAIVVGPAESIESALDELRLGLAPHLDLLAFVTQSRFQIIAPRRLMEWEPYQRMRQARIYATQDARYPPAPDLIRGYLDTVQAIDHAMPQSFTRAALRYFRYGLLDNQPEDQFMRFWLALEIVAENVKEKDSVPIRCPSCDSALKCGSCDCEPTRVPMAKQAIKNLIESVAGPAASAIVKRQFEARNALMHGGSAQSVEAKCKMSLPELVNELGTLAWRAIGSTMPQIPGPLLFEHRGGQFTNMFFRMAAELTFEHTGDGPHPEEGKLPKGEIELQTRFGSDAGNVGGK